MRWLAASDTSELARRPWWSPYWQSGGWRGATAVWGCGQRQKVPAVAGSGLTGQPVSWQPKFGVDSGRPASPTESLAATCIACTARSEWRIPRVNGDGTMLPGATAGWSRVRLRPLPQSHSQYLYLALPGSPLQLLAVREGW